MSKVLEAQVMPTLGLQRLQGIESSYHLRLFSLSGEAYDAPKIGSGYPREGHV